MRTYLLLLLLINVSLVCAQKSILGNHTIKYSFSVGPRYGNGKSVNDAKEEGVQQDQYGVFNTYTDDNSSVLDRLGFLFSHNIEFEGSFNRRLSYVFSYGLMRTNSAMQIASSAEMPLDNYNDYSPKSYSGANYSYFDEPTIFPFVINQSKFGFQLKQFQKHLGSVAPVGRYWSYHFFILRSKLHDINDRYDNFEPVKDLNWGLGVGKGSQNYIKGNFVYDLQVSTRLVLSSIGKRSNTEGTTDFERYANKSINIRSVATYLLEIKLGFGKLF